MKCGDTKPCQRTPRAAENWEDAPEKCHWIVNMSLSIHHWLLLETVGCWARQAMGLT